TSFSPDYLLFAINPFSLVELEKLSPPNSRDNYFLTFSNDLRKAWSSAKEALTKSFQPKLLDKNKTSNTNFSIDQYVWLSKKAYDGSREKSLFSKFDKSNLGPYRIVGLDEQL